MHELYPGDGPIPLKSASRSPRSRARERLPRQATQQCASGPLSGAAPARASIRISEARRGGSCCCLNQIDPPGNRAHSRLMVEGRLKHWFLVAAGLWVGLGYPAAALALVCVFHSDGNWQERMMSRHPIVLAFVLANLFAPLAIALWIGRARRKTNGRARADASSRAGVFREHT